MLGRYRGPIVLREIPVKPVVPGNYPRKAYPMYRNIYGQLIVNHQVTLEQELQEIRTRHARHREYHRALSRAYRARQNPGTPEHVSVSHCEVDEPDPR